MTRSYGDVWRARLELARPLNAAMAAVAVLVGALAVHPSGAVPWPGFLGAALAAFLLTGYGNALNDLLDLSTDRRAHPGRPLPSGRLRPSEAKAFLGALLLLGLWQAWVAGGVPLLAFALVNAGLLALYAWRLKATILWGNATVGLLVASTFAFGAVAAHPVPRAWGAMWVLMLLAFLATVARELVKDLQDAPHDVDRRTFPQARGAVATRRLAAGLVVAALVGAVALALHPWLPWQSPWLRPPWPGGSHAWRVAVLASVVLFAWALRRLRVPAAAQRALRLAMLAALAAFLLGPLL